MTRWLRFSRNPAACNMPHLQGFHSLQDLKASSGTLESMPHASAQAGTTPSTPAHEAAGRDDIQAAASPAGGSAGNTAAAGSTAATDVHAPATPVSNDSNVWPSAEELTKRARKLIDLLGQAVAIAEQLGLLQPLPDSELTGQAAADAALKGQFKEPGSYKARAARPASAAPSGGLGTGLTTAEAAAAAGGAASWSQPGSPDLQDMPAELALLDDGGIDDLLLDDDLDNLGDDPMRELAAEQEEEDDEELHWKEEQYEDTGAAGGDSDAWQQQLGNRARGGRVRKPSVLASGAAETEVVASQAAGADAGATGRRRAHRPSKRLAEHVVYDVPDAGDAGATWTARAEGSGHVTKKVRKDMQDLIMVWGLPPVAAPEDPAATAAGGEGDYDWEAWYGSSCLTPGLKKLGTQDLTLVLKELLTELEAFNNAASAAAAAGIAKAKNQHNPNCECVVCTNRRRYEERKQQEVAAAAIAAAAAAGASEGEQQAAGAATVAALQSKDEAAEVQEEKQKPAKVPVPQGEVLTALTASRLQERLETLEAFNAAAQMLGNPALDAAFKRGSKDLPGWWAPEHDEALILGVLQYGFGNWGPIVEDPNMPFKAAAMAALAAGLEDDTGGSKSKGKGSSKASSDLPSWVPDPKVLGKRCKTLVAAIKKILAKPPLVQKAAGKGGHASKGGGGKVGAGKGSQGVVAANNPAAAAQQMQQLAAMGLLRPGMVQQIGSGGAVLSQQQQLYLAQQQQATVLGKRTAGMAGLPAGPEAAAAAAAAAGSAAPRSAVSTPTLSDGAAVLGAGGATVAPAPTAAVIVTAGPSIAGAVAQAASPPLSAAQVRALEQLPRLVRDAGGRAVLPLMLPKELTLLALGRIEPLRPGFHTASHIFPIGYSCSAKFLSSVTPGNQVTYTCAVADGGASGPLFVVMAPDHSGKQWAAATVPAVWQQVQEQVQQVQQQSVAVDGYELFGLNNPLVSMLIQELPGADQCKAFDPAQSAAPPQMATAIKQCQHIMAQRMQQLPASAVPAAIAAATGGPAGATATQDAQQKQKQALQVQMMQQQLARMQGSQVAPQQQQQQAVAVPSSQQQQQMVQLLQQRQALQQQQAILQQQLALRQQQQHLEEANKRRRTSGTGEGSAGAAPTGQQAAQMAAAGQMAPGLAQQLLVLQQQQQAAAGGGVHAAQLAYLQQQQQGQLQQQQQQQYLQRLSQQQQQALLLQLAASKQQQQQQQPR